MKYLLLTLSICFFVSCATTKKEYCKEYNLVGERCDSDWERHQRKLKEQRERREDNYMMHGSGRFR